jgi:hypothetical protein
VVDVAADVAVDGGQGVAEFGRCGWAVGAQQRSEQPVVEFGVEDRDALAVRGQVVGVGVRTTVDEGR